MKKSIFQFLLIFLALSAQLVYAQDIIIKKNGEEIKSKVVDIGKSEIKYKNFEDPEFTTYVVDVKEVKMIRFEDGTEKIFKGKKVSHFIAISFSEVNPTGNFGATSINPQEKSYYDAGYAKKGEGAFIDAGFYFWKNLGISVAAGGFENKINDKEFQKSFQPVDPQANVNYSLGKWHASYILFGPIYSFKIGRKFAVDLRIMAGNLTLNKPEFEYHYNRGFNYDYHSHGGKAKTFALSSGINFRYHFSKRFGARLGFDALSSSRAYITYTDEIDELNLNGFFQKRYTNNTIHQKLDVVKINFGIMFLLNR